MSRVHFFAVEIVEQDSQFYMDSHFNNISLEVTINTYTYTKCQKYNVRKHLSRAIEESYFIFNRKLYMHVD